jgi:hypothetical protein
MSKEAIKQALDELRYVLDCINQDRIPFDGDDFHETIKALEEALKQEQGEPVAYINIEKRRLEWAHDYMSWDTPTVVNLPRIPLYTTLQQRKPLTDEQLEIIWENHQFNGRPSEVSFANRMNLMRAIEAAHGIKEKNT